MIAVVFLIQAGLGWLAYRSCKRTNADAAKDAESPESDPVKLARAKCVKEIRNMGMQVIVLSWITLFVGSASYVNTNPPMGGLGHFAHGSALALAVMSLWGVATGVGLRRAYRWAWISMLVFCGLLMAGGILLTVPLLKPGEGVDSWPARIVIVQFFFLPPAAIGLWWFSFFLRTNVRSYFGIPRKAPEASA